MTSENFDPRAMARERIIRRPGQRTPTYWPRHPAVNDDSPASLRDTKRLHDGARAALEGIDRKRVELEGVRTASGERRFTPAGVREELRHHVEVEVVSFVRRARKAIAERRESANQALASLTPAKRLDPGDAASAIYRSELRAWLRAMDSKERHQLLLQARDRDVIDAALSGPAGLSGISADLHALLTKRSLETYQPAELAEATDFAAAVESLEKCLEIVENAARAELDWQPIRDAAESSDDESGDEPESGAA